MDFSSRRSNAPLWPPSRAAAYQNLSSTEDLPMHETPPTATSNFSASRNLLTPAITPSTAPFTPGYDSKYNTPHIGSQPQKQLGQRKQPWYLSFGYGWRGGARIAFFTTLLVFIANVVILVYILMTFPRMDGFPVVYRGTCDKVEAQNRYWHWGINILSTIVLAGSNYCMQLLSAPTRSNIDKAHAQGRWLDIGIPSFRNLRFSSWRKRALWLALAISSIPMHLIYNSVFYSAIATNDYNIIFATEQFPTGGSYNTTLFPDSAAQNVSHFQAVSSSWTRLNNHDCIQQYSHDFITDYKNVIAVITNHTVQPFNSVRQVLVNELPPTGTLGADYDAFAWICNDTQTMSKAGGTYRNNSAGFVPCSAIAPDLENIANSWWKTGGFQIAYCLAEPVTADCHLHFAPQLMGPVVFMNIVKLIVIFYVAFRLLDKPLVTLGDAIESFIITPDPTTRGMCLASAKSIHQTFHIKARAGFPTPNAQEFQPVKHRWHNVITYRQWLLICGIFGFMLLGIALGLVFGTRELTPPTFSNAWSIGLSEVQTQNLILRWRLPQIGASAVLLTAIIANAPQALLSFIYVIYNTLFTLMYLGEDWDLFGYYTSTTRHKIKLVSKQQTHRYLRVSDPRGQQKSTHFLNLPYRFAFPLICVSGLLHWLCSQSFYLANISVIPRDGTLPRQDEITTVAFAPQGMVWLGVVEVVMIILLAGYAMRRFGGQMSIVGSNSAAISASCHIEMDVKSELDRQEMVMRKLAWGEIPRDQHDSRFNTPHVGMDNDGNFLGKAVAVTISEPNKAFGLGIDASGREVLTREDFNNSQDPFEDDNESGYAGHDASAGAGLRGNAEMMDGDDGRSTGVAHCCFSDSFVFKPRVGSLYA